MDNEEMEVTRLPRDAGRTRGPRSRSLAGSPPLPRRVRRLLLLACTLILAILALASRLRSGGGFAVFLFPTATPKPTNTEIPAIVVASMTATAQAQDFRLLEQRALHLPAVAPGSPCPLSPRQQINPAYGPAAGQGPVYLTENLDGTLVYVDAAHIVGNGSMWGGTSELFVIAPAYTSVALIRGRQIDGPHDMRFNGGLDQQAYQGNPWSAPLLPELKIAGNLPGSPWVNWLDNIRLQAPG
jgi:hypothetical protein